MKVRTVLTVTITLAAVLLVGIVGGLGFAYSGLYDIAARTPHLEPVRRLLTLVQERAVSFHARDVEAPPLHDPALIRQGLVLYRDYCVVCHGAPGVPRDRIGIGLNPNPPPLAAASRQWSDAELYWIIANGLKMAGMPAFGLAEEPEDLWALVAFTRQLRWTSTVEYQRMVAAVEGRLDPEAVDWVAGDLGFEHLRAEGRPELGLRLIEANGCNTCHLIPGARDLLGMTGPPLTSWSRRTYIAGRLPNTPNNLIGWILNPQAVEPGTAMPDVGLTPEEALHVAAYLFTLE